ncbi:aminoglycoside phosphotransferase family protein [Indioceanicola profundi]|uniref:aminoglycoside phosphotransferase family protein n=1 Tax=Indioceanicola profundi TaxID=2220096 RepID=UPI000E6AB16B|nr:phosphotransferase [Indioceanicola profundi]
MTGAAMEREPLIRAFLAEAGWGDAGRMPLGADWSTRRYERLHGSGGTAILMDAPAPWTHQVAPFVRVCGLLRALDLSAPAILAADAENGLALTEDFGGMLFADLLDRGEPAEPLYRLALDVLVHIHRNFDPSTSLRPFDRALFLHEVALFGEMGVPALAGRPLDPAAAAALHAAWSEVLTPGLAVPGSLLLRDYFPGNIMDLPGRPGIRRCGLLDVQDAGIGPISYDVMSLLEDARRDVPEELKQAMVERYLAAMPDLDRAAFLDSFAVMGGIRHARILGRLAEIVAANPAAPQRRFLPRVWRQFHVKLAEPVLAPVKRWVQTHVPDNALDRILGVEPK